MKKSIFVIFLQIMFGVIVVQAQQVKSMLTVNGKSRTEINVDVPHVVELYAMFRQGKHKINFNFEGSDLPKSSSGKGVATFNFVTTVKQNGKVIGKTVGNPYPFFPGNMFMPVETFDFIPILFKNAKEGQLPKGSNYEILLEVVPVGDVKGNKAQAIILFKY